MPSGADAEPPTVLLKNATAPAAPAPDPMTPDDAAETTPGAEAKTPRPADPALGPKSKVIKAMPYIATGFTLGALWLFLQVYLQAPDRMTPLLLSVGALFSGGKEASIPLATGYGIPAWFAGLTIFIVDVAAVAWVYPPLHYGLDRLEQTKGFVGAVLRKARAQADRRRKWVDRWGPWGLYFFAIIPFAFNGPPQVIVLGRLAGLRPAHIAPIVGAAIATTTVFWIIISDVGNRLIQAIDPRLPLFVALTITAFVVGSTIFGLLKDKYKARRNLK